MLVLDRAALGNAHHSSGFLEKGTMCTPGDLGRKFLMISTHAMELASQDRCGCGSPRP